ncbi:MAG TPA: hypothetical protein VGD80_38450 [Kofleriaceae bacterium]
MKRHQKFQPGARLATLTAAAIFALHGCSANSPGEEQVESAATTAAGENGSSTPISDLPFIDASANTKLLGELLARPTALGETTALHVKLPPPRNRELSQSLVRIVGPVGSPQVMFSSDALARLGVIARSPGPDFFTTFATLPPEQLEILQRNQDEIRSGTFGDVTDESVLFSGRSPVARTINPRIDASAFKIGNLIPINRCLFRPISTQKAWDQALFIRDKEIVQDKDRTWDPCTGNGTKGGVWTFAHLMREMATGSGKTPEAFVTDWLSMWLNDYVVNADTVAARPAMFNQVIQPWATASGVVATLVIDSTGHRSVTLSGPLDLDIAPYRLLAIVNRIDLGETVTGPSGYSGNITSLPKTPGELRFIFGVVQPNPWGAGTEASCGRKRFTTIFEYGVPGEGCDTVVAWAKQWTTLQAMPDFTAAYKAQLEAMTESVVVHGAAPAKGNQNAINQIRTNEIALTGPWELREFTLTAEKPGSGTDLPINGGLRKHTVAQTPNDGAFSAAGADPTINNFINGPVLAGVVLPASNPNHCETSYTVPYSFGGSPFRGGNTLIPPTHWEANSITSASSAARICARHAFSLNTCGGCHQADSGTDGTGGSTSFTHVDPLSSIPVTMSKFLTGGGPTLKFLVADTQLHVAPIWPFADLQRRLERLFELSHCTSCSLIAAIDPGILAEIQTIGPVPIDPGPLASFPFQVGPVTDLGAVARILDMRAKFGGPASQQPTDLVRTIESFAE